MGHGRVSVVIVDALVPMWHDGICNVMRASSGQRIWNVTQRNCPWKALQWPHNGRDGISNHQPHDCLLNRLFRRRTKKASKLRVTGLCAGKPPEPVNSPHKWPVTRKMFPFNDVIVHGEFPAQMTSNAENVSIWWRHHGDITPSVTEQHG